MKQSDKTKIILAFEYIESELKFLSDYEKNVDWHVYQTQRAKRLEIERWVESLINATLDISKVFFVLRGDEVPETSREILYKIGSQIFEKEDQPEAFSEFAKIRNTLAHRYLDIKWNDIKKFIKLAPELYPPFLSFIKKELGEK